MELKHKNNTLAEVDVMFTSSDVADRAWNKGILHLTDEDIIITSGRHRGVIPIKDISDLEEKDGALVIRKRDERRISVSIQKNYRYVKKLSFTTS